MAFDYIFKLVMKELLAGCDARAEKVGTLPLEIDMVARYKGDTPVQLGIPLLARHFAKDNLLEYKSDVDKPSKESFSKLLGYVGLYGDQHGIGIDEMRGRVTAWYIAAKRPGFLDGLLACKIAESTSNSGVYEVITGFPCPCRVVVCDELDVTDENVPLLLLGSIETIKRAIVQIARAGTDLRNAMGTIISLIYYFYHDKVKDMTEINEILPADVRRSMKHAIEDLGIETMITEIGLDKVIDAVGVDKVIDAVGIDQLEQAIARRKSEKKKPARKARKSS
nr:hypothetical protein [Candidatus Sigynarchaeota archaeon]